MKSEGTVDRIVTLEQRLIDKSIECSDYREALEEIATMEFRAESAKQQVASAALLKWEVLRERGLTRD